MKDNIPVLSVEQCEAKQKLLNESNKDPLKHFPTFSSQFDTFVQEYSQLISRKINPTESIQELLNDALVQEWVRSGIDYHRNKRENCAFCGARLSRDLWSKLDAHFSEESETLRKDINILIKKMKASKESVENAVYLTESQVYSIYQPELESLNEVLSIQTKKFVLNLAQMIIDLENREKDIFNTRESSQIEDNSSEMKKSYEDLNDLIDRTNNKTATLTKEQSEARNELRLDEVAKFVNDIDYSGEMAKTKKMQDDEGSLRKSSENLKVQIELLEKDIAALKLKLKDERQGAEKVNQYLNHYFGHDGLRLVAKEEDSGITFNILRGDELAHSLSEGECSLIAFCYFMARLEDIDTKGKEVVIWLDDPISSLDSNHIYFVFSLIENVIAKPYKNEDGTNGYNYKQLFVSTHNLDFLKYLKRLQGLIRKKILSILL